ncbi:MAG: glycosyltransferase family 2 protein [Pyrinomonadaceae bacterium]
MSERVCAVVVTYNRQALLRECLLALQAQTRPVDEILIVNNASTDQTGAMLRAEFPHLRVLELTENAGGSGGFHDGMEWAFAAGYDWLWLMDDDGRPAVDCLAKLLAHGRANSVVVPVQQDSSGRLYGVSAWRNINVEATEEVIAQRQPAVIGAFTFAFVGPLIHRAVVKQVGLPNRDFFIWFDDHEYALRIQSRTQAEIIIVPDALFFHNFGGQLREVSFLGRRSSRVVQPAWKSYYGVRNHLYTVTRTTRKPREVAVFFLYQIRRLCGDLVFEPDRWRRVRLRLMGISDGALGRLGKRVPVK